MNISEQHYRLNMDAAFTFTKQMGLSSKDVKIEKTLISIENIIDCVLKEFYIRRGEELIDFTNKCYQKSIQVHSFLLDKMKISSILTTGNVYKNGKQYYHESKDIISSRVKSSNEHSIPRFHTWLTIGDYIVDFVLKPSEWYAEIKEGKLIENEYLYKAAFRNHIANNLGSEFSYEPLFLGIDYFNKVKFKYKIEKFGGNL